WYSEIGDGGPDTGAGAHCRIAIDPMSGNLPADCSNSDSMAGAANYRVQAPRELWDSTFVENSWITNTLSGNKAIALLPRMNDKLARKNPHMKLAISEWNYGGGSDVSGTIASADVLGLFGVYGVEMAMMWPVWHDESFTYAAFDVYRNFDGNGA